MWTISLPLRVPVSKNRDFSLNLNQYRNAHFQVLDKAKKAFTERAVRLIRAQGIPVLGRCTLEYILHPGTRQICDTNNVCTVVDKFFSDSLVSAGVLVDDDYNFIVDSRFRYGGIDRDNPRVDVIIRSPDHASAESAEKPKEETPIMKVQTRAIHVITLTEEDLIAALRDFLKPYVQLPENVELGALRKQDDGYELRIETGNLPAEAVEEPKPRTRKPKAEPRAAIQTVNDELARRKAEAAAVAEEVQDGQEVPETTESETKPETGKSVEPETTEQPPENRGACTVCGTALDATNSSKLPNGKIAHIGCTGEKQNAETPAKEEFDHSPKTAEELEKDAKGPETAPPTPGKKPSLFANFSRPKN